MRGRGKRLRCPEGITPNSGLTGPNNIYIYIYIYTHTHTHKCNQIFYTHWDYWYTAFCELFKNSLLYNWKIYTHAAKKKKKKKKKTSSDDDSGVRHGLRPKKKKKKKKKKKSRVP